MGWQNIIEDLHSNQQQLDRRTEAFKQTAIDQGIAIPCRKGCANCCSLAVNCSFPEAAAIADNLDDQQKNNILEKIPVLQQISRTSGGLKQFLRRFRDQSGGCPFLREIEQSCVIHPVRPFTCRALLSTRPASWCGIDFATLHPLEKEAFLSSLNPEIVSFPTHYLAAPQELAAEFESTAHAAMRDTFGTGVSGNMIYLVWLELEYQIRKNIEKDPATPRRLLLQLQSELPYLLQVN